MMKNKGFSLVELMVALAIIGILTMVALPTYQSYVKDSNRASAQADLMALAAAMERHKATTYSYAGAATGGADTGAPSVFQTYSPSSEPIANRRYDLTIDTLAANGMSYRLRATPAAGSVQVGDGDLYYFSDGRKGWDKNTDGVIGANEFCWKC